jgi:hypothetical protein
VNCSAASRAYSHRRADQFRVRAGVDQLPVIEDDDPVGALHGGQPMGDDDRRPAAHCRFQRRLHDALAFRVEAAGRFVEQQQRRVLEDRTGDGDALPLAARQANAALADEGRVALGQSPHEFVDEGRQRRPADFLVAGLGLAVAILSAMLPEKITASCGTTAMRARSSARRGRRKSMPSMRMAPSLTS